ncbi:hypothetical protein FPOAC2_04158 [Fusarium poae]|uniref:hypothetical protein n=1 Tax=Fusarium poae TaxID=36050 RepID=UPI001CE93C66|nr:hypothetical protein FPOAC1_004089 [Fusarium poae]KAG8670855.1 hypothetical protein FPOAC1_004089 [Fusarium poae]
MVSLKSLVVLLALGTEALAGLNKPAVCSTILGTKTVKNVPTSTLTNIKKITITKRIIRRVNVVVIPVAKTTTIKTTKTDTTVSTAPKETDTVWSTVVSADTTWLTRTAWTTSTVPSTTITTKYFVSTISAPSSFVPIKGDPSYVARKRDENQPRAPKAIANDARTVIGGSLPQSVRCVKEIPQYTTKTVSTTIQGPRKTVKAATKTKMSTVTTTSTSTIYPERATTTSTTIVHTLVTSFTDVLSTTVTTQIVTVESAIPTDIVYDQCSDSNMVATANGGKYIGQLTAASNNFHGSLITTITTPRACCTECAANPFCLLAWHWKNLGCYIYTAVDTSVCANGQFLFTIYETSNTNFGYVLSNGPCGLSKNGGPA